MNETVDLLAKLQASFDRARTDRRAAARDTNQSGDASFAAMDTEKRCERTDHHPAAHDWTGGRCPGLTVPAELSSDQVHMLADRVRKAVAR